MVSYRIEITLMCDAVKGVSYIPPTLFYNIPPCHNNNCNFGSNECQFDFHKP